ncbi:hypothetical protein A9Q84_15165 [Halobacteriovorax marinus]|uniref:Uncharacterized protein n=1 Tax=Halobacteriovorax marinus TaxID=97084 RepID=A0A1Y5F5J7_9BACT|nr:hypothetical protein A9Q84_15165 [Halobacteriovorax marinus]
MKNRKILLQVSVLSLLAFSIQDLQADTLPDNYEKLTGCKKQEILWEKINSTVHEKLPKYSKMGLTQILAMAAQRMTKKVKTESDVAPKRWKKYLHRRGVVAKVKFVPKGKHAYSGIFEGADCALLRLSLTFKPTKKRGVAPGLAFKVLRDKVPSANVSALYTLGGQKQEFNFFKNPLSNIVPIGTSFGEKIVHNIFERVTDYPEQLSVLDMAAIDTKGKKSLKFKSPKQLFFVPSTTLTESFSSDKHDIREDILSIREDFPIYKVYAVSDSKKDFNYYDYSKKYLVEFLKGANYIGDIVTTSKFLASEFGDTRIFFKHQKAD